jgi:probable F420-dependent oxidoreductase
MEYGLTLPGGGSLATAQGIAAIAAAAERRGVTSIWAADHVAIPAAVQSRYPYSTDGTFAWSPERPWLDPFLTLGLVAASTRQMGLGTSVVVLPLRHPLLIAKMAASLDYLSGGRMILGVGVGWLAEEFELLGQRFDDRYERTAECIAVLRACWGPNPVRFKGNHFDLPPFAMSPKPVKGAGMRVLVGGTGDSALRLLAEAGNGWHPLNVSPAAYESALGRLQPLMAERRRSMSDLMLTAVIDCKLVTSRRVVDDYASLGVVLIVLDIDYSSGSLAAAEAEMERLGTILDL